MKNENTVTADNEWLKRCEDFEQSVLKYKSVRFSRFVSPHDLAVFKLRFKPSPFIHILAFGGASDCERVQIGFFPDFLEPDERAFPISPILLTGVSGLSHRDILGSVLGLGIKREMTGDIFVDGDRAVIMSDSQVRDFLLYHLKTVGRKKVEVSLCPEEVSLSLEHAFQMVRCVVASARLDALVGAAANLSRSEAQDSILGGNVSVNFVQTADTSKKLCAGDVISVRHHGRFVLENICGETKKGRLAVELKKYI
ncbi:MAG TPA: hypothetical protein DD391_09890 [Clostridiales bacterium]|nr:hypothetical protein [Clostridiales bacterium]HBL82878.1 hypothetical protein [Clostridiales bacterium]